MPTNQETGNAKNVANANQLISFINQLGHQYDPANTDIQVVNLQLIYDAALSQQEAVNTAIPPYKFAVDAREELFAPLSKKVTKLFKVYQATQGVTDGQLENFMTIARKLKGKRKVAVPAPTPPEPLPDTHSVSQMSYDQRTNNFQQLIDLLQTTSNYAPNEREYQISTLQTSQEAMMNCTQQVADTYYPLTIARGTRNMIMYSGDGNLVDVFNTARNYLFSILETNSPLYKDVMRIKFVKR